MNTKRCVVSVGYGGWYNKGAERLHDRLNITNPELSTMIWANRFPKKARHHSQVPYDFKPKAIREAYNAGYTSVIWMDTSVYPNRDVSPLFEIIERDGYLLFLNGWTTGEWCSDAALKPLDATREELMTYQHGVGGLLGFDLSRPDVLAIFEKWDSLSTDAFPGPWDNKHGQASKDLRVLGHRHDQTVISVLAHRAGWRFTPPAEGNLMTYGSNPDYLINLIPAT